MKALIYLSIALATLSLALAYGFIFSWGGALAVTLTGLLWLLGGWREVRRTASSGLVLFTLMAAFGVALSPPLPSLLLMAGGVSALAAWDLDHFCRRLARARAEEAPRLQEAHLRRLLPVLLTGFFLAGVAATLQVNLSLAGAVILGVLAVLGLGGVAGLIKRQQQAQSRH